MTPRPIRTDTEVQLEQMEKLYLRLYPFMFKDFRVKADHDTFVKELKAEFSTWQSQLNTLIASYEALLVHYAAHTHVVTGTAAAFTVPPFKTTVTALKPIVSFPKDIVGSANIVPLPPSFLARKPLPGGQCAVVIPPFDVSSEVGMGILEGLL